MNETIKWEMKFARIPLEVHKHNVDWNLENTYFVWSDLFFLVCTFAAVARFLHGNSTSLMPAAHCMQKIAPIVI